MKNIFISFFFLLSLNVIGQTSNRLFSRLFYLKPDFHESNMTFNIRFEKEYTISVLSPIDNRKNFVGEIVTKRIKVQEYDDFWSSPLSYIITNRLNNDFKLLGFSNNKNDIIEIIPIIEVMYTCPRGFIWLKCYSKVRIKFIVKKSGMEILSNAYESVYFTSGTDSEYEGKMTDTIENFANITLGICFRKSLDKFYDDLYKGIK